ncbi:hypothetical protein [Allofournierella massiliensis]|uniref:Uncharacterized protein n=1 Tax=Allofournierella massiliensis TaxID=1650663 RepID=A0ABT7UPJ6_9FIRM|nr:hypothetical protein [Fournierella massiliensis]MDM8200806.1 hypothetical protein [Fournierella massiliensis]
MNCAVLPLMGTNGRASEEGDMVTIAELETFEVSIDGNTVEWSPMERG